MKSVRSLIFSAFGLASIPFLGCSVAPADNSSPATKPSTYRTAISEVDPRWTNYGRYLQEIVDTIQAEWDDVAYNSGVHPPTGSHVSVTFVLNSEGNIPKIVKVEGNAGMVGEEMCVTAIVRPTPYAKWTSDMVASLGNEQQLTFAFYYY